MSRTALQIAMGVMASLFAVTAVGCLILGVRSPLYNAADIMGSTAALDSTVRVACGMLLGVSIALFWRVIPRVETELTLFRALGAIGILGGVGRLISMVTAGMPPPSLVAFTVLELVLIPALIYWQTRVARLYAADQ